MSASSEEEGQAQRIKNKIKDTLTSSSLNDSSTEVERVSTNAKIVILGLFCLVGFLVSVFAITTTIQKAQPNELFVQVFTAAVTGSFTLGGTLLSMLWGK